MKAFKAVLAAQNWRDVSPEDKDRIFEKNVAAFASAMETTFKAFEACTTADELERKLTVQRAGQALEEFIRAAKARKDLDYARERFWAVFTPHQSPRLF